MHNTMHNNNYEIWQLLDYTVVQKSGVYLCNVILSSKPISFIWIFQLMGTGVTIYGPSLSIAVGKKLFW